MTKLKIKDKFNIIGRGDVFTLNLKDNNISTEIKEFGEILMNKDVEIDGKIYHVKGIEAFATGESYVHENIGILVKEITQS